MISLTCAKLVFQQECTGSICLAYGLESCQCIPGPNDPPTKACELCCRLPGENQPCLYVYLVLFRRSICAFVEFNKFFFFYFFFADRLRIGTPHRTIFPTCTRSLELRVMIITATAMSFKNVVR